MSIHSMLKCIHMTDGYNGHCIHMYPSSDSCMSSNWDPANVLMRTQACRVWGNCRTSRSWLRDEQRWKVKAPLLLPHYINKRHTEPGDSQVK